ncbi:MAG: 3-dehydroquinate synthase family protein [Candidatus Woesearchaeota archaeon]
MLEEESDSIPSVKRINLKVKNRPNNMLGPNSYDIYIGRDLTDIFLDDMESQKLKKFTILTDENVADAGHLENEIKALESINAEVIPLIMPPGEKFKTGKQYLDLANKLAEDPRIERSSILIALGGGVVGDMGGFLAATVKRGLKAYFQKPTSTVSQSDSSVGGKTGVDTESGVKNALGVFIQPNGVYIDVNTLRTTRNSDWLYKAAYHSGLAEIVKYAFSFNPRAVRYLERNVDGLKNMDLDVVAKALAYSVKIKRDIVQQDIGEQGIRAICNLGHTFGHAFETVANEVLAERDEIFPHGYAVSVGTVYAAALSMLNPHTGFTHDDFLRECTLLQKLDLPISLPVSMFDIPLERYLKEMSKDKKVEAGNIKFVLQDDVGKMHKVSDGPYGGNYKMGTGREIPIEHLEEAFTYVR